jgi:hypothetical protein
MEEFRLIKLPRYRASIPPVISAMAGALRPEIQTMKNVVIARAAVTGTRGRLVSVRTEAIASHDTMQKTRGFPARSAQRPIRPFLGNRDGNNCQDQRAQHAAKATSVFAKLSKMNAMKSIIDP